MAAPKKKINTDAVDLEPIDLDPPNPAIARWEELADWDGIIHHDGDAEKMLPFPRPAWADPDEDEFGQSLHSTNYSSRPVRVSARYAPGNLIDDNSWAPAAALVSAELAGDGIAKVLLTVSNMKGGSVKNGGVWLGQAIGLTVDEALELADVLRAAVDLIGGVE